MSDPYETSTISRLRRKPERGSHDRQAVYDILDGEMLIAADPLGVERTPTLYLADREGRVIQYQHSFIEVEKVEKALSDLP